MRLDQFSEEQFEEPDKFQKLNGKGGKKRFRNKWKKEDIRNKRKNKNKRQDSW